MKRRTNGFTMIELLIVLVIGSLLTGMAMSGFRSVQTRFAVQGAKEVYMTWHQRARSMAIEKGETVAMVVDLSGNSTYLVRRIGGVWEVSDTQLFDEELGVDLRTQDHHSFYLCMTPRGYADANCGSLGSLSGLTPTYSDTVRLQFWLNADSASVLILPMGQLVG